MQKNKKELVTPSFYYALLVGVNLLMLSSASIAMNDEFPKIAAKSRHKPPKEEASDKKSKPSKEDASDEEEYEFPLSSEATDKLVSAFKAENTIDSTPKKVTKKLTPPASAPENLNKSRSKLKVSSALKGEEKPPFTYEITRGNSHRRTNIYFNGNSTITWGECELHNPEWGSSHFNKLNTINNFWVQEAKNRNASFNHLACNVFCILKDANESDSEPTLYESPLFTKAAADPQDDVSPYNFSVTKDGTKENGWFFADFVSSSPVHSKNLIQQEEFFALEKGTHIRPQDEEITNHGDLLALYTLKTNKNLFFKLITKRGHRNDYTILSFGTRFFSSLDACEDCNTKIYNGIYSASGLRFSLQNQVGQKHYTAGYAEDKLPFHTFFYSYRPYTHGDNIPKYLVTEAMLPHDDSSTTHETTAGYTKLDKVAQNHSYVLKSGKGKEFNPKEIDLIRNKPHDVHNWEVIYSRTALLEKK